MKKSLIFLLVIVSLSLAACDIPQANTNPDDSNGEPKTTSPSEDGPKNDIKTLAYSTYLAGSLLSTSPDKDTPTGLNIPTILNTNTDEAFVDIEKQLGEASTYFSSLRVFLDHGLDNPFTIEENLNVNEDYEYQMRYTVNELTYTILFNEDDSGTLNGVLIMNGNVYLLSGERENDGSEEEIYLKTTSKSNNENYIEIEVESSIEDADNEFEMSLQSVIDGVEKSLTIEFEFEEGEASIEVETSDSHYYSFERESDDDGVTEYYFEYLINVTKGEVELTITRNSDGTEVYHYTIEENGEKKIIEDTRGDRNDDNEDDDEEDSEDDEDEDDTSSL